MCGGGMREGRNTRARMGSKSSDRDLFCEGEVHVSGCQWKECMLALRFTMTHFPVRSWRVTSGGAAIVVKNLSKTVRLNYIVRESN